MNSAKLQRLIDAIESLGLDLGDGIHDRNDLAERVECAAANFEAGRKKERAGRAGSADSDDDWEIPPER